MLQFRRLYEPLFSRSDLLEMNVQVLSSRGLHGWAIQRQAARQVQSCINGGSLVRATLERLTAIQPKIVAR